MQARESLNGEKGSSQLTEHRLPALGALAVAVLDGDQLLLKANAELTSLAKSKSLQVPTEPNATHKAEADRLSKLSGAEFDKAYMTSMVADHDHDVAMFRNFSERGDDAGLKAWAAKTLPTLQDHERLAKTTASKVGISERTGSTGMGAKHATAR